MRGEGFIDGATAAAGLELFGVDELGLDKVDRAILDVLCRRFGGRPVGLTTLAQCVGEEPDTIEDAYEPYPAPAGADPADGPGPGRHPAGLGPPGSAGTSNRAGCNEHASAVLTGPPTRADALGSALFARSDAPMRYGFRVAPRDGSEVT